MRRASATPIRVGADALARKTVGCELGRRVGVMEVGRRTSKSGASYAISVRKHLARVQRQVALGVPQGCMGGLVGEEVISFIANLLPALQCVFRGVGHGGRKNGDQDNHDDKNRAALRVC